MKKRLFYLFTFIFFVICSSAQNVDKPASSTDTVTDIDGNVYKTVKIGKQWWMAENLKVTHYRNGEIIPNVSDDKVWFNLKTSASCCYRNDTAYVVIYGRLYNKYAAVDGRKIAPKGWHVPTDDEWQLLVDYLGGDSIAGGKMKSTGTIEAGNGLWHGPNEGATNESGFSALPGGGRTFDAADHVDGSFAYFWSTKKYHMYYGWHRYLSSKSPLIYRYNYYNQFGFSIRCVKD